MRISPSLRLQGRPKAELLAALNVRFPILPTSAMADQQTYQKARQSKFPTLCVKIAKKYFYKFYRFKSFLLSLVGSSIPFPKPKIWGQEAGNIYR